jgi:hypothetical protein
MIDVPNLVGGFILGVLASLAFLFWDRAHERRRLKDEVQAAWISAASEVELLLWRSETTSVTLQTATARLPLDRWRRILGPGDFRALEKLQAAYAIAEMTSARPQAAEALTAARVEFANLVRYSRSDEYTRLIGREERQRIREDFRRHPIKTWKRQRHNRRVRATREGS